MWFRVDLRVEDNTALAAAAASSPGGVVGLYVISPEDWARFNAAPCKVEFVLRNLRELSRALAGLNIPLLIRTAPRPEHVARVVAEVAREHQCRSVHWNAEYEVWESRRDEQTRRALELDGVTAHAHHDQCILPPGLVKTQQGGWYTVFTPFKKAWLGMLKQTGGPQITPTICAQAPLGIASDPVPVAVPGFQSRVSPELWPAGEAEARRRLRVFCDARIRDYKTARDFPYLEGTSTLSPYLTSGVISPRVCLKAAIDALDGPIDSPKSGVATWISELVWREFYKNVTLAFPRVCMGRAFKPATDRIVWSDNEEHYAAWCEGRTGVPIVDAAMRCLARTGWMHNRLRMIVAMFLAKDLFLDWRKGEAFFHKSLIDGDLAQNNGGWQWSAGTGTDSAPYFRIFNPYSQSEKFDPEGAFVRRWVPELRDVQGAAVHNPAELPALLRATLDYPEPIVDHALARERVLRAFQAIGAAAGLEAK
jgi:deoxyribodipyrimidine photo-lyase